MYYYYLKYMTTMKTAVRAPRNIFEEGVFVITLCMLLSHACNMEVELLSTGSDYDMLHPMIFRQPGSGVPRTLPPRTNRHRPCNARPA